MRIRLRFKVAVLVLLCAMLLLTGCGDSVIYKNGIVDIKNAHITISVPEDWTVRIGDEVYKAFYSEASDEYDSVEELKASYEDVGERLLLNLRPQDEGLTVILSETDKGEESLEELLRFVHDTTVFDFRSSGFYTESSFEEYTWGGVSGFMSIIKVFEDEGSEVIMEEREFCFERGEMFYALEISILGGYENEADSVELTSTD